MSSSDPIAAIVAKSKERATCRGCGRLLDGDDYMYGGRAYVPHVSARGPRREAKINHFGGFVCSRQCDFRAALALEQSMPGHGYSQRNPNCYPPGYLDRKWDEQE